MNTAWYTPSSFSPIPVGRSSGIKNSDRETSSVIEIFSDDSDSEEFMSLEVEGEIWKTVEYIHDSSMERLKEELRWTELSLRVLVKVVGYAIDGVWGEVKMEGEVWRMGGVERLSTEDGWVERDGIRGRWRDEDRGFLAHGSRDILVPVRILRRGGD